MRYREILKNSIKRSNRIFLKLKYALFCLFFLTISLGSIYAQTERKIIKEGNEKYNSKKYSEAEIEYKKSLEKNKNSTAGKYNLGNSYYRQDKMDEAAGQYQSLLLNKDLSAENKAKAFHNLGNTYLKAEKFKESIDAYKNSLKLNPKDNDTRYNLAYAQAKLQQQQQQQQQNKDNKDNKDNQENKDQQKQDQKEDKQENKENKDSEQQKQGEEGKEDQKSAQKNKNEISKEDAEKILQALNNDEKQTQKKLTKKDATKISIDKKW
ncbi:MAG: tetratricopeptide repeat protein [Bacteroidetes bacterium]|nr:MAG: tetratricopeptide repeat protein [Bacteroidota bacterium]